MSTTRDPYFFVHIASAQTRTNRKQTPEIMFNARGRRYPSTPTSFEFPIVIRVGRKGKNARSTSCLKRQQPTKNSKHISHGND